MMIIINMVVTIADTIPRLINKAAPFIQFCGEQGLLHAQVFDQLYFEDASADEFNKNLETINSDHTELALELCLIIQSFNIKLKGKRTLTCQLLDKHKYAFSLRTEKKEESLFRCFQALLSFNRVYMIHRLIPYIQPTQLYGIAKKLYEAPDAAPPSVIYKREAVRLLEHIVNELAEELLSDQAKNNPKRTTCINSLYWLGNDYQYGKGVNANFEKAVRWYQQAAKQGHATAQCSLGYCYDKGIGVPQDAEQAVHWFQQAADQGHVVAQVNLGLCYAHSKGVAQDDTQAVHWYQRAANQGHAVAQFNLGVCYAEGTGVPRDPTQAVHWYQQAAKQGYERAQFKLGVCYDKGKGVAQDAEQAAHWYQQAAKQGHATAQCSLGYCYEKGQGVPRDPTQAVYWFQQAANQGHAVAQYNLGYCYEHGKGVAQDDTQAVHWFQ